ncbi:MAG: MmcQ/YjbR family DNA-binding protein [Vicinamibacterales bacterium]
MDAERFRDLVLGLAATTEASHMGHPDFRVNGRIFASLSRDERTATLRLSPAEQAALLDTHPASFAPAAGAWGRQGWTIVQLDGAPPSVVRAAVLLAWEALASTARPPRRAPRARRGRPSSRTR